MNRLILMRRREEEEKKKKNLTTEIEQFFNTLQYSSTPMFNTINPEDLKNLLPEIPSGTTSASISVDDKTNIMNLINKYSKSYYKIEYNLCEEPLNCIYSVQNIIARAIEWRDDKTKPFALVLSTSYSDTNNAPIHYFGNVIIIFDHIKKNDDDCIHIFQFETDWGANNDSKGVGFDDFTVDPKVIITENKIQTGIMKIVPQYAITYNFEDMGFNNSINWAHAELTIQNKKYNQYMFGCKMFQQYALFELENKTIS